MLRILHRVVTFNIHDKPRHLLISRQPNPSRGLGSCLLLQHFELSGEQVVQEGTLATVLHSDYADGQVLLASERNPHYIHHLAKAIPTGAFPLTCIHDSR